MAEIVSGIDEGTRVITHPSDRVADGVEVVDRSSFELLRTLAAP
jgi:hypothetical protein